MKTGDLVILRYRYKGVDLEDKDRKKIGIVVRGEVDLAYVYWNCGNQIWCLHEQLQAVKKCP